MPGPSETLPVLEQQLAERLLAFETMDEAWPRGRTAIERGPRSAGSMTVSAGMPGPCR